MGRGGFIFSKQTVEPLRGESLFNWCLKVHKARVSAFLDASNKSNAGWSISRTGGEFILNEVKCIYSYSSPEDLNMQHPAFGTFFKHTSHGEEDAFFWIGTYSEFAITHNASKPTTYYPEIELLNFQSISTESLWSRRMTGSCMHAYSLNDFGSDSPATSDFLIGVSTCLSSSTGVSFESSKDVSGTYTVPLLDGLINNRGTYPHSFGYAVRNNVIEMFYRYEDTSVWETGKWVITLVGDLIDKIILSDIDKVKLSQIVLNGHTLPLGEITERSDSNVGTAGDDTMFLTCFTQEGRICPYNAYREKHSPKRGVRLFYENPCVRFGEHTPSKVPYTQAVLLITGETSGMFAYDGAWAKGFISSDILRVVDGKFVAELGTTNTVGDFLKCGSVNDDRRTVYGFLIGWDPSNGNLL